MVSQIQPAVLIIVVDLLVFCLVVLVGEDGLLAPDLLRFAFFDALTHYLYIYSYTQSINYMQRVVILIFRMIIGPKESSRRRYRRCFREPNG